MQSRWQKQSIPDCFHRTRDQRCDLEMHARTPEIRDGIQGLMRRWGPDDDLAHTVAQGINESVIHLARHLCVAYS